jgi:CheY-like chemotaxis protein
MNLSMPWPSGDEALNRTLERPPPDLINALDSTLRGINGLEVVRRLVRQERDILKKVVHIYSRDVR